MSLLQRSVSRPVDIHSVFAKNRQRLLDADVVREFLLEIVGQAREQRLLCEEHFSVDGTLLEPGRR